MADTQLSQLERLRRSMQVLESQRADLGDAAVEPALLALKQQITNLEEWERVDLAPDEVRRIVTILFIDIVGSSAIAAELDPEDWRGMVAAVHEMAGKAVQAYGGAVVQYLGDGLLALFGVDRSSERDPERAVCAALEIQRKVPSLEVNVSLQLRAGIHTGLVVMGDLGSRAKREFTASGDAMNLASRMESAAPPGGVLISHGTYGHIRGLFEMTARPALKIKGRTRPVQTYLVSRYKQRPFHIVSRGVAGLDTATVGREAEKGLLRSVYREALEGEKLAWVQLVGNPGLGKSRLMADTLESLEPRPEEVSVLKTFALEGDSKQPYALVRRMWFDHFQIPEDAPLNQAEGLWVEGFQATLGSEPEEAAHALGLLMGLPFHESPHIGAMRDDPLQLKGRAFTVSRQLFDHLRGPKLLALLVEDLHWADPSSWEYLTQTLLHTEENNAGTFILATARPEWKADQALQERSGYLQLDLKPLSQGARYLLATELLQRVERVPERVLTLIADRSEGVPYFAEEIVNWFIDQGVLDRSIDPWRFASTRFESSPLPTTLQQLLQSRLGLLEEGQREALEAGAIFGRTFWEGGLKALGPRADGEMLEGLDQRGYLESQPLSSFEGEREWRFHHSLMRDVAYEGVLKRKRPALHRAAGDWLEAQARKVNRLDEWAGRIGQHAERAGETRAAAGWYLRAGKRAKRQGALREARELFEHTLELIPLDDPLRRWETLLNRDEVLVALGDTQGRNEGLISLQALADDLEEPIRKAEVYYRQAVYFENIGQDHRVLEISPRALRIAQEAGDEELEMRLLSIILICQTRVGDLEKASALAEELLLRSQDLEDESTLARIMTNLAVHYTESGDLGAAVNLAERQIMINHRLRDRVGEAIALNNLGHNYLQLGQYAKGRTALERALKVNEALGARRIRSYVLLNLGLCNLRRGDVDLSEALIKEALQEFEVIGDAFGRGSGHTYMALVLEQEDDIAGASQNFTEARAIFAELGLTGSEYDTVSGLVRCSLACGSKKEVKKYLEVLWKYLSKGNAKGMEFPIRAYQTCAKAFEVLGDDKKARGVIEIGYQALKDRANKISDAELRKSYQEYIPEHHSIIEMWNRVEQ